MNNKYTAYYARQHIATASIAAVVAPVAAVAGTMTSSYYLAGSLYLVTVVALLVWASAAERVLEIVHVLRDEVHKAKVELWRSNNNLPPTE